MYLTVFTYEVTGIDRAGWAAACDGLAPVFASVPGLVSKTWLNAPDGTYGGVYLWLDRAAFEAFLASDLGVGMRAHPNMANLQIHEYEVDEVHSRVTKGVPVSA